MNDTTDIIVYRASELGGCEKALVAKRMGFVPAETPEKFKRVYTEGDLHEAAVLAKRSEVGAYQNELVLDITKSIKVVGHVDGLDEVGRVVEIKTMSEDVFKEFVKKEWDMPGLIQKYKWQISCYMIAAGAVDTHAPGLLIVKNRNTGEERDYPIAEPFWNLLDIRLRVLRIEAAARKAELPETCDSRQFPCPFYYLHEDEVVEPETPLDEEAFNGACKSYLDGKEMADRAKKIMDDSRAVVVKLTGKKKIVTMAGYTATPVSTKRKTFNKKKAKEDGVDVEKYEDESVTESVRIGRSE